MLILLTGPSGAGKTTTLLRARDLKGWTILETLTTRPQRSVDNDTKTYVESHRLASIQASDVHKVCQYDGHIYLNEEAALRNAARAVKPIFAVDWVHPYPEDLARYGPYAAAFILLPSKATLLERLEQSGRVNRTKSALSDHERISNEIRLPKLWHIIRGDDPSENVIDAMSSHISHFYS